MTRLMLLFFSFILIQCGCAQFFGVQPPSINNNKSTNTNVITIPAGEKHVIHLIGDTNLEKQEPSQVKKDPQKPNVVVTTTVKSEPQQKKENDVQLQNNTEKNSPQNVRKPNFQKDVQSGALLRGFYVFVSLSALVLIYLVFRSYRIRRNKQSSVKVKKYGVVTRRNDIEMRRLELDEEEDESVFDIEQHRTNK